VTTARKGIVYLVGAGPGSADLLTLRAHGLVQSASCILHDDLVSAEVLALAAPGAVVRNVGKRCGQKTITQDEINTWMVEYALQGESVVRLKSGDPLLFGRAMEELAALDQAGIPFEIVPGVSTGFAAAALAATPLTGRITSSRVLFATRHRAPVHPGSTETSGLSGIGPDATLVLYMPGRDYAAIALELAANGWPPETHCILASALGSPSERMKQCLLRDLAAIPALPSPVIMLFAVDERRAS
jgi:uroporphyrin-III C-methyltransferase